MLAGTEDAAAPFWSPDSQYLGFVADQKLKRISASGGEAQALTEDAASSPGDWGADGTILFHKQNLGPISRVPASGGEVLPATRLDETDVSHYAPSFLPDGKHFLYVSSKQSGPEAIKVGLLGKPEQGGIMIALVSEARFASGHLLFVRSGRIQAQSFDLRSFKLSGDPQTAKPARSQSRRMGYSPTMKVRRNQS
jgi:Tol biopolymer transport system component